MADIINVLNFLTDFCVICYDSHYDSDNPLWGYDYTSGHILRFGEEYGKYDYMSLEYSGTGQTMISPVLFSAPRKIPRFKPVKVMGRVSILPADSGRFTAAKVTMLFVVRESTFIRAVLSAGAQQTETGQR